VDLNRIAVFVRVVDEASFTAAADALGVPKSSVSRSVSQLEADLGVLLLHRTTRKLKLTDAGTAYYARAKQALASLESANADVSTLDGEPRGLVRMTAPIDAGSEILADLIARFVREHPAVQVELVLTGKRLDLVDEGIDLALRAGKLDDSSLIARKVLDADLGLFASEEYLARRGRPKRIADLAHHDCLIFRPMGTTWTLVGPEGEETVEVSGSIIADEMSFLVRAIASHAGIGLLPTFIARRASLVRLLPESRRSGGAVYLVMPSKRVPRRVALLRDYLIEALAARAPIDWSI
jgi:DNA-binding transcriptional LysR family regulator